MQSEYTQLALTAACIMAVYIAMKQQLLIDFSPLLALLFAAISNYALPALSGSGIVEMLVRLVIGYAVCRGAAELTKRSTAGQAIRYATEQPVIEFEEVA